MALFISNSFEKRKESVDIPFFNGVKDQSDKNAIALMRAMKWNDYFMSFCLILLCFAIFFCLSFTSVAAKINLDLAALIFTILCQVGIFLNKRNPLLRIRIKDRIIYLYKDVMFKGVQEVLVFFISLLVSYGLRTIIISSDWLSKISIAILFLGLLIDIWEKDQ